MPSDPRSKGFEADCADEPPAGEEPPRSEPIFNLPAVVWILCLLMAAIHLVRTQILNAEQDFWVLLHGAFIPVLYSRQFALDAWSFTSPFTYTLLHGDFLHLAVNTVWLAAFGSPLANRLGALRFLLFWAATGLAAVALHYLLHAADQSPLIGASGAVSGMMGAAARFGFHTRPAARGRLFAGSPLRIGETLRSRSVLTFLGVWMAINAVTGLAGAVPGLDGRIAWEAHIGGFLAGFLGIGLFLPQRQAEA